jgi:hypothetical protein
MKAKRSRNLKPQGQAMLSETNVRANGQRVSYRTSYGAIGLSYRVGDRLFVSGGNGFHYPNDARMFDDGGKPYRKAVRGLNLPPAYSC